MCIFQISTIELARLAINHLETLDVLNAERKLFAWFLFIVFNLRCGIVWRS